MKISLHIEADSAEEFRTLLAALGTQPVPALPTAHEVAATLAAIQAVGEPKPEPAPEPTPAPAPEPVPAPAPMPEPEEPVAAVEAAPKKPRGRPRRVPVEQAEPVKDEPVLAKAEAPRSPEIVVATREDLAAAFTSYVHKYGIAAAQSDINKLLSQTFGADVRRMSDVSEDNIGAAIVMAKKALQENPFKRNPV